jgi:PPK2 family polyphosphate:nucleotide phosphotransferase
VAELPSKRRIERFIKPFRIADGRKFKLKDVDPDDTGGLKSKQEASELLAAGVKRLAELQDRLYAQDRWSVLLVFQAMDAAGKDGTIKHVMSGVNPSGCQVFSFKAPSAEDLDHDFMWRTLKCLPERGRIGIFNRSYYEDMLVVRVHPELLHAQKLPPSLVTDEIWKERFEDVHDIERYLSRNGVVILKFFLHVSKEEQRRRFMERLQQKDKNWKFSMGDAKERNFWQDYQRAYEDVIQNTASDHAPWYVVPADHKWFTRLVVAGAIIDALEGLDLHYPVVDEHKREELVLVQAELEREVNGKKGKAKEKGKGKGKKDQAEAKAKGRKTKADGAEPVAAKAAAAKPRRPRRRTPANDGVPETTAPALPETP